MPKIRISIKEFKNTFAMLRKLDLNKDEEMNKGNQLRDPVKGKAKEKAQKRPRRTKLIFKCEC